MPAALGAAGEGARGAPGEPRPRALHGSGGGKRDRDPRSSAAREGAGQRGRRDTGRAAPTCGTGVRTGRLGLPREVCEVCTLRVPELPPNPARGLKIALLA